MNMKYAVWHAKDEVMVRGLASKPQFPQDYTRVAVVECETVGDVFRATNHVNGDWKKNPEVVILFGNRHRSTSVGDVVEEMVYPSKKFMCAGAGWEELP